MTNTWNEYQNALNVVKTFEREREELKSKRRNFNWKRTMNDIVWEKRMSLNKEMYDCGKLSIEAKLKLDMCWINDSYLPQLKKELYELRLKASKMNIKK